MTELLLSFLRLQMQHGELDFSVKLLREQSLVMLAGSRICTYELIIVIVLIKTESSRILMPNDDSHDHRRSMRKRA